MKLRSKMRVIPKMSQKCSGNISLQEIAGKARILLKFTFINISSNIIFSVFEFPG